MKKILLGLCALALAGCAQIQMQAQQEEPEVITGKKSLADTLPYSAGARPIRVAVYGFTDKTGQKKPNDKLALFSTAVTQGAEVFLIKALQDSKNWFTVVERVGIDNLIKERQLIKMQREMTEGGFAKQLTPMSTADIIIEGGIIGYDTNLSTGGNGARILGIGGSQQYRSDEVVISMRVIRVETGEVILTTNIRKNIFSTAHSLGVLRFVDAGTKAIELEHGVAINEPTTYAVRVAIEQGVYEMILEGDRKGIWRARKPITKEQLEEQLK